GGTIERCDPPNGFAATWEYGGEVSWIELRLSAEPRGATRFELDHIAHVDDTRAAEFGPGAVGVGWDLGLIGLAIHLATGQGVDRQAAEEWTVSEEGRRFMSLSSQGWRDASVAAGADEVEAQAAADRTTAFYTGATPDAAGAS
ncbi:MAG: polyketide cyclase, partial [Solirubrobacteraceae bacterium]